MNKNGTVTVGEKDGGRNVKQRQFSVIYLNAQESRQTTDINPYH